MCRGDALFKLPMVTLLNQLSQHEAQTFSLVLNSAGIDNRVDVNDGNYRIGVPEPLVQAALIAIHRFQAENPPRQDRASGSSEQTASRHLSGVVVAILLLVVHLAVTASSAPDDYVAAFGASARHILEGDIYRCVTALLLHADAAHVVGNMAAVAFFGGAVCAATGTGVGWLMILACGASGNLANAAAHDSAHLSIGASTAVFGSVGMLCAIEAVNALKTGRGWKRSLMALGAGLALLAFLGASARSDLGAHLFGFLSGLVLGAVHRLWRTSRMGMRMQILCGLVAVGIVGLAWIRGAMA
jgi:membrane associated rhomboid family serine protease